MAICLYRKSEAKSEVKDEDDLADVVKQQSDDSDAESENKSEANVDADVRDIRYNLETLSCDKLVLCFPLICCVLECSETQWQIVQAYSHVFSTKY